MAKTLYREFSNKYGSSRSAYTGCSTTACKGEQVAHDLGKCIVHLNDSQANAYEQSLRGGVGALNFSSLEVDADFVSGWVSRVAIDAEGYKRVPVPMVMLHTRMVDALVFHRYEFPRGLMLQGLKADAVRIGESTISGGLSLDSAEIEDEVSLQQLDLDKFTLVASRAKILWLLNCSIQGQVDARSLTLKQGLHLRGGEIGETANFRDSTFGQSQYNVTISGHFRATADFTGCTFPSETQVGRYADLPQVPLKGLPYLMAALSEAKTLAQYHSGNADSKPRSLSRTLRFTEEYRSQEPPFRHLRSCLTSVSVLLHIPVART
jgi:hypothetical protein